MRTTLTIEDDILALAKALAARDRKTIGEVISDLARKALSQEARNSGTGAKTRNGVLLLPVGPKSMPVTPEMVSRLREELP